MRLATPHRPAPVYSSRRRPAAGRRRVWGKGGRGTERGGPRLQRRVTMHSQGCRQVRGLARCGWQAPTCRAAQPAAQSAPPRPSHRIARQTPATPHTPPAARRSMRRSGSRAASGGCRSGRTRKPGSRPCTAREAGRQGAVGGATPARPLHQQPARHAPAAAHPSPLSRTTHSRLPPLPGLTRQAANVALGQGGGAGGIVRLDAHHLAGPPQRVEAGRHSGHKRVQRRQAPGGADLHIAQEEGRPGPARHCSWSAGDRVTAAGALPPPPAALWRGRCSGSSGRAPEAWRRLEEAKLTSRSCSCWPRENSPQAVSASSTDSCTCRCE